MKVWNEVVVIYGDGNIAIAKNYESAIYFLLETGCIDEKTEIFDNDIANWMTIKEKYGDDWKESLLKWNITTFNVVFENLFYIDVEKVVEV